MIEKETTSQKLDALALDWANGKHFRDVLWEAYYRGYADGCDDGWDAKE